MHNVPVEPKPDRDVVLINELFAEIIISWRGQDLNLRPSGYEPDELPDCSTPRRL